MCVCYKNSYVDPHLYDHSRAFIKGLVNVINSSNNCFTLYETMLKRSPYKVLVSAQRFFQYEICIMQFAVCNFLFSLYTMQYTSCNMQLHLEQNRQVMRKISERFKYSSFGAKIGKL